MSDGSFGLPFEVNHHRNSQGGATFDQRGDLTTTYLTNAADRSYECGQSGATSGQGDLMTNNLSEAVNRSYEKILLLQSGATFEQGD